MYISHNSTFMKYSIVAIVRMLRFNSIKCLLFLSKNLGMLFMGRAFSAVIDIVGYGKPGLKLQNAWKNTRQV